MLTKPVLLETLDGDVPPDRRIRVLSREQTYPVCLAQCFPERVAIPLPVIEEGAEWVRDIERHAYGYHRAVCMP